ncbi:MAG: twin-arginine translocation signal domain-containing protein, partial [Rhizobiales bacterium]|nr:twin-arginine translocation signal domain-containing protein [Hyphomicrobiales bacterium]
MISRRHFIAGSAMAAGLAGTAGQGFAQARQVNGWPSRTVRSVVPSGAGGPGENFRFYMEQFREAFGQPFVLENQPGASGAIGSLAVARSAPDGHTLLCAANSHVILAPLVSPKPTFDVKKAFAPIGLVMSYPFCLIVNSELPVKTIPELVAYAKERPGQTNFGSIGIGTGGHLVAELFCKRAGINAVHVPFTGAPAQVQAVAAGTLQFTVDTIGNSLGAQQSGKIRQIAVTGAKRTESAPHLPTFAEAGFEGFELLLWLGRTPHAQLQFAVHGLGRVHGLHAVARQVEQHLLDHGRIAEHGRQAGLDIGGHAHAQVARLQADQRQHGV